MPTVNIKDYEVEVTILSFDKGEQPYKVGHPDNWTPGSSGYIEFVFSTDNKLLNEILTDDYYTEAKDQLLAEMEKSK